MVLPLHICYTFYHCPTILGHLMFSVFFLLLFSFESFHCYIPKLRDSFLCYVQSTDERIKTFCISVRLFFISSLSFYSFLGISSLCLHCSCMLSNFSIKALSILINYSLKKIPFLIIASCHIWLWFWCLFSLLKLWAFSLLFCCWKVDMMYQSKGTVLIRPLVMYCCGGRGSVL